MDHLVLWGRDGPTDLVGVGLELTILILCGRYGPTDLVGVWLGLTI